VLLLKPSSLAKINKPVHVLQIYGCCESRGTFSGEISGNTNTMRDRKLDKGWKCVFNELLIFPAYISIIPVHSGNKG